jgi:CHAD domain-containing protein
MTHFPVSYIFELPWNVKGKEVLAGMADNFTTAPSTGHRARLRYYDTFDWRLYDRGLSLVRTGDEYQIRRTDGPGVLESGPGSGEPRFWWDFPEGGMRDRLRGILKVRAVTCVGEVALRTRDLLVLNSDAKTVARLSLQMGEAYCGGRSAARIRSLNIIPVKGYTKEARQLAQHLTGVGLRPAHRSTYGVAVVACGREPGDYTSKLTLQLDASMPARQAAAVIFGHLLDTMERNIDGIRNDVDTEFLHDFRVAIRRTRSGLTQLKKALPDGATTRFGQRFAVLGRGTNRLRDLDVYLLNRDHYRSMLDADLRSGLDPLFEKLARERKKQLKSLVGVLDGSGYLDLVREWRNALKTIDAPHLHNDTTAIPVGEFARKVIKKRHNCVIRMGRCIADDTPDTALHALRIECKKLRYILEFFASLYAPDIIGGFVKQLKHLQDNLGDFNDLSVQQKELMSFLQDKRAAISVDTAAAVGVLVAKLEYRQRDARRQFSAAFDMFGGPTNEKQLKKLFESTQR